MTGTYLSPLIRRLWHVLHCSQFLLLPAVAMSSTYRLLLFWTVSPIATISALGPSLGRRSASPGGYPSTLIIARFIFRSDR